jgi:hypothetical protein
MIFRLFRPPRQAMSWKVERWGGTDRYPRRVVFIGSEDKAREKYAKVYRTMRQGTVELLDGKGETIDRAWAPRLRTRW